MLRAILVGITALGCFSLVVLAQPVIQPPDKKTEAPKGKDDGKAITKDPGKSKTIDKAAELGKDPPKAKIPLDKLKLPKDAIILIMDDVFDAMSLFPKSAVMSFEAFMEMKERILVLERQLKGDKKPPSICKFHGKLEGDFFVFRAEYEFSTEQPKTTIALGLKGGYLIDEGELDRQPALLDFDKDDGFILRVEKEGNHQVTLNFRVPVKKSATGTLEREIEFGLPGAPTTILNLEMPGSVKELLWNGTLEKAKTPGRWLIGLAEKSKSLSLSWKEPLSLTGNAPLAKAETQIKVDIDATHVNILAELLLEDSRAQTKEWHLLLPPQSKVNVAAPGGLKHEWLEADEKTPYHILRTPDTTTGRWQVLVELHLPRPNPGTPLAIGPFHVLGAFEQNGKVTVKMPAEASLGQRLVYTRAGETYQTLNAEAEAAFRYMAPLFTAKEVKAMKSLKAPLELEWRFEKNQLETQVVHDLKLQGTNQGWEIEATTRIQVKALFSALNAIDLKLPLPRPSGVAVIGTAAPGLGFPGVLPWGGIWKSFGILGAYADLDEFTVIDDQGTPLKLAPLDGAGKVRVLLERGPAVKQVTLTLKHSLRVPAPIQRIRLELPRPLGTQDRGAKLTIQADKAIELLQGPAQGEEPVPDRHHFDVSWDQTPPSVDLAWRPYHREIVAQSIVDINLHQHTAQVKQSLRFPRDIPPAANADKKNPQYLLAVPLECENVKLVSGGEIIRHDPARQTLWLRPSPGAGAWIELELMYDLSLGHHLPPRPRTLEVAAIWPASASAKEVKVRIWSSAGVQARLAEAPANRAVWKERSIEIVPNREQLPSVVLQGHGANVPLSLEIGATAATTPAAFRAERALIQIHTLDDGSQQCRARYLIRKIHAPHVDLELPASVWRFRDPPTIRMGKHTIGFERLDASEKLVRLKLHPDLVPLPAVLEISYTIPADGMEPISFWRTTLHAPAFHSEVVIGQMRWQLTTPRPMIAASLGRNVRPDVEWGLQSWMFTPEASVTNTDKDAWLSGKDAPQDSTAVTFSFALISMQPETVYHLPPDQWLLGCSGILLIVTLGAYFSPMPRSLFWLLLLGLALAMVALAILCPGCVPAVLFGIQPGVVLFVLFVGIHWVMQVRYRRQLVFLPGFTRAKPGSTMVHAEAAKRPREASTVDVPGSSAESAAAKPSSSKA